MISEAKIAEIRERTDLLALVGQYVNLRRVGGSAKGLCPFHAEKTPSFYVHPARQFFHCFGCGASGDAFAFLMRLEGLSFPDVARQLAEHAGVELENYDAQQAAHEHQHKARKDRWFALLEDVCGYFMRQLHEHPLAAFAQNELTRRNIQPQTTETFRLGYAPHGWDQLLLYLEERGHSLADAEQLGVIVPRRNQSGTAQRRRFYDRFRHRLMFPVSDSQGRIVAFSGRALPEPPDAEPRATPPAKYINSPEHPLYRKGELLFGLYEARVALRRQGEAVICEGNFDLLALHQAGIAHVVAPLGTALTEAQCKLLRRYADRIVLMFDGDDAGKKAARAAFPLVNATGLDARVALLPAGKDPDSYVREFGPDALKERLHVAAGIVEFIIDDAADRAGSDARARAWAIESLGEILAGVDNPVEERLYTERIARRFEINDLRVVRAQLRQGRAGQRSPSKSRASASSSSNRDASAPTAAWRPANHSRVQWEMLGAMLDFPELFAGEAAQHFDELLTDPQVRVIFDAAADVVRERGYLDAASLLAKVGEVPSRHLLQRRLSLQKHEPATAKEVFEKGLVRLAKQNVERELPMLARRVKEARTLGNEELALELTQQRDRLFRSAQRAMQIAKG